MATNLDQKDEYATFESTTGLVQKKPIPSSLKAKAVVLGFLLLAIGAFVGQKASQALAEPLELTDVAAEGLQEMPCYQVALDSCCDYKESRTIVNGVNVKSSPCVLTTRDGETTYCQPEIWVTDLLVGIDASATITPCTVFSGSALLMPTAEYCSANENILVKEDCQIAYDQIEASITEIEHTRALQVGAWDGVPYGCSIQMGTQTGQTVGSPFYKDYSAHWNTKSDTNNARAITGEFRVICAGEAAAVGTVLMPTAEYCSANEGILDKEDCQIAYDQIEASSEEIKHTRALQVGAWDGVPYGCSIQMGTQTGQTVGSPFYKDYSAHWNTKSDTSNARAITGEFRVICAGVPDTGASGQAWDPANCPGDSPIHATCWADAAYQECNPDRSQGDAGAYHAVMAQSPNQELMFAEYNSCGAAPAR